MRWTGIEEVLRRLHPTGAYEGLVLENLDQHWPAGGVLSLLEQVGGASGLSACLEPLDFPVQRRHVLHIGLQEAPDWEEFNRLLSPSERAEALEGNGGSIAYWNILLSRLGPFWTGNWNVFGEKEGNIEPELSEVPHSFEWGIAVNRVHEIFSQFYLAEVDSGSLFTLVSWMTLSRKYWSPAGTPPPKHPTLYDALFEDKP